MNSANTALPERGQMLRDVCLAIRLGCLDEALLMLRRADGRAIHEAAHQNLMGVIHEARHEWKLARKCYGNAMRADRRYWPAQQNLRRLYELHTFGHCIDCIALGDESPALMQLLRLRDRQRV